MAEFETLNLNGKKLSVADKTARTAIGDTSKLNANGAKDLVTAVNNCFRSASNLKKKIAEAITGKGVATSASDTAETMAANIEKIQTGIDTNGCTASPDTILEGYTAGVQGEIVEGTIPRQIFSTTSPAALGFHAHGYTYQEENGANTFMMPTKGYYDGMTWVGIKEPNLVEDNVKAGVQIGEYLTGTYTSDANATSDALIYGRTAYVNGQKITGSMYVWGSDYGDQVACLDTTYGAHTEEGVPYVYLKIPDHHYINGINWVRCKATDLAEKAGITPSMIVSGNTVLGINGTMPYLRYAKGSGWNKSDITVMIGTSKGGIMTRNTSYEKDCKHCLTINPQYTGLVKITIKTINETIYGVYTQNAKQIYLYRSPTEFEVGYIYAMNSYINLHLIGVLCIPGYDDVNVKTVDWDCWGL